MSNVRKSDLMLFEGWFRQISAKMYPKVIDQPGYMNADFDNPVLINWGSNGFYVPRDELAPLIEAMEDEHTTPNGFLNDVWMPFLREWADR